MTESYKEDLQRWALPQLTHLLPLPDEELKSVVNYVEPLSDPDAESHLQGLLGDSPEAIQFTTQFIDRRSYLRASERKQMSDIKSSPIPDLNSVSNGSATTSAAPAPPLQDRKSGLPAPLGPPPANGGGVAAARHHTNPVIEAGKLRARDEVRYLLETVVCTTLR